MCSHLPLIASLLLCATAQAGAVQLSLRDTAMVRGPRVSLGDVASFGSDAAALAAVDLGSAPFPGYTTRLSRVEIARMVRAHGPALQLDWQGAEAVRIERRAFPYDSKNFAAAAEAYLRQQLRDSDTRVELELTEPLPDVQLPVGEVELKPRPLNPARVLQRQVTVWLEIVVDGRPFRQLAVPFKVRAYKPALVTGQTLLQGTAPQCDKLSLREVDVAAIGGTPVEADCRALRGSLKQNLAQGTALLKNDLQVPLAVAQGDDVSLRLAAGTIMLEVRAHALADGEIGQHIEVRPAAGTHVVNAEVIAPGVVQLTGK